jgi:hypothetical protein
VKASFVLVLLALLGCSERTTSERTAAGIITVPAGADLQQAIERARPGDIIQLTPGATYTGNFILPDKSGSQFITIRTADAPGQPRAGQRVAPSHAAALASLKSPNVLPALRTAPGAHHWRLELLEFRANKDGAGDIIALGDGSSAQNTREQAPRDIIIDRCYIHGDATQGQKRGIALNSASTHVIESYISDIKVRGQDSQALGGWNGPGPYRIENNYLEAAGENILLGGADPAIDGLVTEDVVVRRNHMTKRPEWRQQGWLVKNIFELKNARRVLVEGNLMEYAWVDGQIGYAIVLTPRNQDGRAPWATVEDVTFRYNIVRHAGGGMQIIGEDSNNPSGTTSRVKVTDNVFYGIDTEKWGGSGAFALIGAGPKDLTIEHNTVRQSGNILMVYGGTKEVPQVITGLRFRDNLVRHNLYGVHGADRAVGLDTFRAFLPGADFTSNAIAGGDARLYPGGNLFVSEEEFDREFVDAAGGDFRLRPNSRFTKKASDGRDLGADVAAIAKATGGRPR